MVEGNLFKWNIKEVGGNACPFLARTEREPSTEQWRGGINHGIPNLEKICFIKIHKSLSYGRHKMHINEALISLETSTERLKYSMILIFLTFFHIP